MEQFTYLVGQFFGTFVFGNVEKFFTQTPPQHGFVCAYHPSVRIPCMLFSICIIEIVMRKRRKINKKRPRLAHCLKKRFLHNSGITFFLQKFCSIQLVDGQNSFVCDSFQIDASTGPSFVIGIVNQVLHQVALSMGDHRFEEQLRPKSFDEPIILQFWFAFHYLSTDGIVIFKIGKNTMLVW